MKHINESSAFDPEAQNKVMDSSFNVSAIDNPIELKRLNNYISTVLTSSAFGRSRKEILIGLRLKLNLLGFDIDIPKNVDDRGDVSFSSPMKRFGGISGVDETGQKVDNPHGPGPKMNIEFRSVADILSARIVPVGNSVKGQTSAAAPTSPVVPQQPAAPAIKEGFTFAQVKKYLRK